MKKKQKKISKNKKILKQKENPAKTKDIILKPRKKYDFSAKTNIIYNSIIIGAGIAGFSAAMYASRLGLKVLVIGELEGGKITLTETVENYPGFVSVNGLRLAELVENHAKDYDIDILTDTVDNISKKTASAKGDKKSIYSVLASGKNYLGKTVVIATGTVERKLNVPGEKEFTGKGVSYCALCDATSAKNKNVVVIGGGDSAIKEANLLARYAKKVYIINNEPKLHAEKYNMDLFNKLVKKKKAEFFNSSLVNSIDGKSFVEGVSFTHKGKKMKISAKWIFIYIGQKPKTVKNSLGIKLNNFGEIIVNEKCETNINGVYAAGDITSTSWKQAIIAAAQGVTAAYSAYNYSLKR